MIDIEGKSESHENPSFFRFIVELFKYFDFVLIAFRLIFSISYLYCKFVSNFLHRDQNPAVSSEFSPFSMRVTAFSVYVIHI